MINKFKAGKTYIFKKEIAAMRLSSMITKGFDISWADEIDNRMFIAKFEDKHMLDGKGVLPCWCEEVII